MVLPAPPAAEGQAGQDEWLKTVARWLHLGHKGVLIMIRAASRARLRSLARMLAGLDAGLVITDRADDLVSCEPGALVLLLVRPVDLAWLNINRPVVAQRSLRIVLWAEAAVGERLKFESPDFHDWISHFVKCPPGVPGFAVEGLRVGSRWWPGVAWTGAGLELALAEVGIETTQLDPDSEFAGLVETLGRDRKAAIRWVGVDSLRKLWRVRWAVAEARHHGFCVLDQPSVRTPGWFPVDSRMVDLLGARALLGAADWLPRAIDAEMELDALELIAAGESEAELDDAGLREVGLLLRPGPRLRRMHESPQVAGWRRELVRAIRRGPERQWSRQEIALFASLERDRKTWPDWEGQVKMRYRAEHLLRMSVRSDEDFGVSMLAAALRDVELYQRWNVADDDQLRLVGGLGRELGRLWDGTLGDGVQAATPAEVLALGREVGWDPPGVAHATARMAESLLDQPGALRAFLGDVLEAVTADLGTEDPTYLWLANVALALAGDPWRARDELEDSLDRDIAPIHDALSAYVAIRVLCGDYSQAAQLLAAADSLQTHLYLALLQATGRSAEAEAERTRLLGAAATDTPPSPETLARELLLTRLRDF